MDDYIWIVVGFSYCYDREEREILGVFDNDKDAKSFRELAEHSQQFTSYYIEKRKLNKPDYYYVYSLTRYPLRKTNNEQEEVIMCFGTPYKEDVGIVKVEEDTRKKKRYVTVITSHDKDISKIGNRIVKEFLNEHDNVGME